MPKNLVLLGYGGCLKSTICNKSGFNHVSESQTHYVNLYTRLLNKPYKEVSSSIASVDLMINYINEIRTERLKTDGPIIMCRSLVEYCFWNDHPNHLVMEPEVIRGFEKELYQEVGGGEPYRFLLINHSDKLKDALSKSGKESRDLTDYDHYQNLYIKFIRDTYDDIIPFEITDFNLDYIPDLVIKTYENLLRDPFYLHNVSSIITP